MTERADYCYKLISQFLDSSTKKHFTVSYLQKQFILMNPWEIAHTLRRLHENGKIEKRTKSTWKIL